MRFRIGIITLLACSFLVAPAGLTGASQPAPAASKVTGAVPVPPDVALDVQLAAAVTTQAFGGDAGPADFLVQKVGDSVVAVPPGAVLTGVTRSGSHTGTVLVVATPGDPAARLAAHAAGWVAENSSCSLIENSTGWMSYCWRINRWSIQMQLSGGPKWIYTLNHEATHKSKGIFRMNKARIRAVPNMTMYWADWAPGADEDHGNCQSATIGVSMVVEASVNVVECDRWDIGKFPEGGRFDNTWFGTAWRSERQVEYLIEVGRTTSGVSWTLYNDFWAYP